MKVYFAALALFLIAFVGLAIGLIFKGKGLRGGCSPAPGTERSCQCKSATGPTIKGRSNRHGQEGED